MTNLKKKDTILIFEERTEAGSSSGINHITLMIRIGYGSVDDGELGVPQKWGTATECYC
jgi:hypothetical protein